MSTAIQLLRSGDPNLRPDPSTLADGMPMVNTNQISAGLFFKLSDNTLCKIGPAAVSGAAPNSNPTGFGGNSIGEQWLDTSAGDRSTFKIYDGANWQAAGLPPGGADTNVQYNKAGAFGGVSTFVFDETTSKLTVTGSIESPLLTSQGITVGPTSNPDNVQILDTGVIKIGDLTVSNDLITTSRVIKWPDYPGIIALTSDISGTGIRFYGGVLVSDPAPIGPQSGDMYLNDAQAVAATTWVGIAGQTVLRNQFVFFTSNDVWELGGLNDVSDFVTLNTPQDITANKIYSGTSSFTGAVSVTGDLTVNNTATSITTSAFGVTGPATFSSTITQGAIDVTSTTTAGVLTSQLGRVSVQRAGGEVGGAAIEVYDGSTVKMSVDSDGTSKFLGNVGVGLTPTAFALDIQDLGSNSDVVRFSGPGSSIDAYLYTDTTEWSIGDGIGHTGNYWGGVTASNLLKAYTNGSERLSISNTASTFTGQITSKDAGSAGVGLLQLGGTGAWTVEALDVATGAGSAYLKFKSSTATVQEFNATGVATIAGGLNTAFAHTAVPTGQTDASFEALKVVDSAAATKVQIFGDGDAAFAGKITSATTVASDAGTTVVTKDFIEAGGGGSGGFGYWTRTGTTVALANSNDAVSLSGTLTVAGATVIDDTLNVVGEVTAQNLLPDISNTRNIGTSGVVYAGIFATTFTGELAGNAATATILATPRAINGTNFDGSAAITTSTWGTSRDIGIGSTTKSVNGSANYSWSLAEIGVGSGAINVNAGNGLAHSGNNANANQTGDTTRTLSVVAANSSISVTASGISVNTSNIGTGNGQINVNPGNGLSASGANASANQSGNTTRTLTVVAANNTIGVNSSGVFVNTGNLGIPAAANNGQINVNPGNGLTASGSNASANQSGNTTRTLTVVAANNTINVAAGGISVNTGNLGIPAAANNGQINTTGSNGIVATGTNATANQAGNTTRNLAISITSLPTR